MKIVQINGTYNHGSTGKIMSDLSDVILKNGHESYMVSGYDFGEHPENLYVMHSGPVSLVNRKNILVSRITGVMGYSQKKNTVKLVKYLDSIKPDIIHLHNIHGNYINLEILFEYIRSMKIPIVWTLHDCWSFTGRCSHFEQCGCDKWKNGCYKCTNRKVYPIVYGFDFSQKMWKDKKRYFTGLKNVTLVTPSFWLSNYVKQSFLRDYRVEVIHNGIDIDVFSPIGTADKNQNNKKIVLGVASMWTKNKGLEDFYALSKLLNSGNYQIVLIGLNSKQLQEVPSNIIGLGRTQNVNDLVEWYCKASVYVNLTYLDTFPTTNLEALACGTPVITYKTGGSTESVNDTVGSVLEQGDISGVCKEIERFCEADKEKYTEVCRQHALLNFNKFDRFQGYMHIYEEMMYK